MPHGLCVASSAESATVERELFEWGQGEMKTKRMVVSEAEVLDAVWCPMVMELDGLASQQITVPAREEDRFVGTAVEIFAEIGVKGRASSGVSHWTPAEGILPKKRCLQLKVIRS